jgi:uncharacterized cupredoxin-like copper-binding protein
LKRIVFTLVRPGATAGAVASMAPISGQLDGEAAPIHRIKSPLGYHAQRPILVKQQTGEVGKLNQLRAQLGNELAITPRSLSALRAAMLAVSFVAAAALAACSKDSQSLADYITAICATHFRSASSAEMPFLTDNVSAMTKMMVEMGINPSGDVDHDFVAMMVPHHQGAIEMAQAELRYGNNETLRRMAQEIIVTQQQEIGAMRLAVGQPLPPSAPSLNQQSSTAADDARSAFQ